MRVGKSNITWREYGNMMFCMAIPIAIQNALSTTASMVDTMMIGSLGELAVAAVGVCSQISSLLFSLYWGFISGSILFLSQYWGAGDHRGYNRTIGYTLVFAGGIGILYGAVNVLFPEFILGIYTDKADIVHLATPYLRIVGFTYPLQVFSAIIGVMLKSTGRVKVPLFSATAALLVNAGINYTLIYGKFGMPKMGVAGAAIGTLLSAIVDLMILFTFLVRERKVMSIHVGEIFYFDVKFSGEYFRKLLPVTMNEILYGIGQMIINVVIGHQDESAIAAMAAFRVCSGFVYAFYKGMVSASGVVVGNEIGAGRLLKGYSYGKRSALVCPCITFTIVLICLIFHEPIFVLFGLEAQAIFYGKHMLLLFLFFGSIRTSTYIMNESFRAGGETVFGTIFELGGLLLVTVPATWMAGMVWKLPFLAVVACTYADELIRLFAMTPYLLKGKWIKPMTEQGKEHLEAFRKAMSKT